MKEYEVIGILKVSTTLKMSFLEKIDQESKLIMPHVIILLLET
jgi:hypothetical protein